MKQRNLIIGGLIITATVILTGLFSFRPTPEPTNFQGYMAGILVLIGSEQGGRISKLFVLEGDDVEKGRPLFELNSTYERALKRQAEGVLAQAVAELKNLKSEQMRPPEIGVLEAKKRSAQAALQLSKEELARKQKLYKRRVIAKAQLDASQAAFNRDRALLDEATSQISVAHLAARRQQIKAAQANVAAAKAALLQAEIKLNKRSVKSPAPGRIEEINFRAGEVVTPNQPVVALLPPENIRVRFFVPEVDLAGLPIGSSVHISCDGCATDITARVNFIARQAEFTPPIIYGPKERAKLVFRVEARPEDLSRNLAPGQPVTVTPIPQDALK